MRTRSKSIFNLFTGIALLASLAGGAVTYTPARAAGILFVKPAATGSGDCSSWANACTLQTAITSSFWGNEIWVQKGTHIPDISNRMASFNLPGGVAIYGGFAGTETQRNQRNPAANVTTLSGDLSGDDEGFTNNDENSLHVVTAFNTDSNTVLDGFRIGHGNADGSTTFPDNSGGGMLNINSSPKLTNIYFFVNTAIHNGGGMHNDSSSPVLTNVTFFAGSAVFGGGMSSFENSSPKLTNVTFSRNSANQGGGMLNLNSHPTLINVTFSGNVAQANLGGGIYNLNSSLALINTIIANSPSGGDCVSDSSAFSDWTYNNFVEDASNTCGLENGNSGNIIGVDPKLGLLANNGGFTPTHALLAGSPAINAGRDANCPAKDQRGMKRPQGSQCDLGAFELELQTLTIAGNTGAAGVKLKYTDGTVKTVTSQPNGNYSLTVPNNWSGTVTPSLACFKFSPPDRSYSDVTANQTGQDYAPSFNPASPCAEVTIKIKGMTETLVVPKNGGERPIYAAVNNGPVLVNGTGKNNVPFIASARVSIPGIFFSEIMGLPKDFLSTKYAFPYYDSVNFKSQLRIVNMSNAATTVTLRIRNQPLTNCTPKNGPYTLAAGASVLVSCANAISNLWSAGPVVVESSAGNIIASLRVLPESGEASVSEVMGVPKSQLAARYAFPWYDNKTLNSQLRVANVGSASTKVRLFIANLEMKNCSSLPSMPYPYNLPPGTSVRVNCAGVNAGPLRVIGSPGIPIVAALRIIPKNGSTTSFSEVMGLPASQFAPRHTFPWYDSKQRDTQLRVGNIGTATTQVRLFIGGVEMTGCTSVPSRPYPYNLPANTSLRVSCAGVNKGPVKVIGSAGVPIVASLRVLPRNAAAGTVFAELIGFPLNKLATGYVLPWYDNVGFHTQLRVAVP
jgi:hypothetical protein